MTTVPAYAETTPATTSSKVDLPGADSAARATIDAIAAEEGILPGDVIQLYKRIAELPWGKQLNLLNYAKHR